MYFIFDLTADFKQVTNVGSRPIFILLSLETFPVMSRM